MIYVKKNEKVNSDQIAIGRECNDDEIDNYCQTLPAKPPVQMGQFNGKRICGKRGGTPFLNATRVDRNGNCPTGTSPCVLSKSLENRLCYPNDKHSQSCPITDMSIVSENEVDRYRGSSYQAIQYSQLGRTKSFVVYSKLVDSLPLTSFRMENKPCLDSWQQSS